MNTQEKSKFNRYKFIYLSLREQYLSGRPMSKSEEEHMWEAWHFISERGWKWARL